MRVAVGLSSLVMAMALCGPIRGQAAEPTLQVWSNSANPAYGAMMRDFEAQNPGLHVQFTSYATNQYLQNLQVAATDRTLPDVFFEGLGATLAHKFIDEGRVLNLDAYAARDHWSTQFLPLANQLLRWKQHDWEVPATVLGMGLFYRRDIFAKYGIAVPATYDQLVATAAALKAHGVTPLSMGGKGGWMTMRFTDALIENFAGPAAHDSLYGPGGDWTSAPVVHAFQVLKDWTDKGYFTTGFLSIDPGTNYVSWFQGRSAMVFEGPWEDSIILRQRQDMAKFGFFPFPTAAEPKRLSTFAQGWMVSADTPDKDAAVKLAEFLASTPVLRRYSEQLDGPFANSAVDVPANQPNQRQIRDLLTSRQGYLPTDERFPQDVVNAFFEHQDAVVAGEETPAEAAAAIQAAAAAR